MLRSHSWFRAPVLSTIRELLTSTWEFTVKGDRICGTLDTVARRLMKTERTFLPAEELPDHASELTRHLIEHGRRYQITVSWPVLDVCDDG